MLNVQCSMFNPKVIQVVIVAGFHLFPFRTEKLSPPAPMVLHTRGRDAEAFLFYAAACPPTGSGRRGPERGKTECLSVPDEGSHTSYGDGGVRGPERGSTRCGSVPTKVNESPFAKEGCR